MKRGPIKQVKCVETGQVFKSMAEAGRFVHKSRQAIFIAINKKNRCAGYHWVFADEAENLT